MNCGTVQWRGRASGSTVQASSATRVALDLTYSTNAHAVLLVDENAPREVLARKQWEPVAALCPQCGARMYASEGVACCFGCWHIETK